MSTKQAVKQDLLAGFRDQKLASSVVPCPEHMPSLELSKITFHGNYVVEKDTLGPFVKPEWQAWKLADEQAPVCYLRGATVSMTVELAVLGTRSYAGTVSLRGSARIGDKHVEWTQDVTLKPGDETTKLERVAGKPALPDRVGCYDPVTIVWEARVPGKAWAPVGVSQHVFYALLAAPNTEVYWTCIDISCRWGAGATSQTDLVDLVFSAFKTRKLTRKRDGVGLSYWRRGWPWADPALPGYPRRCVAVNTWGLLHGRHGRGQCGAWAEFLIDTCRVHGVPATKFIIQPPYGGSTELRQVDTLLVKNWRFTVPPDTSPSHLTHHLFKNCVDEPGVPGQRNPNPPGMFMLHFIARIFGKYYDPSYGSGPFVDEHSWEAASLDGLASMSVRPALAGFVGSPASRLVFREVPMAPPSCNTHVPEDD